MVGLNEGVLVVVWVVEVIGLEWVVGLVGEVWE